MTGISEGGMPGTYVLVVHVERDRDIRVGSLGRQAFRAGWYLYVGSALGGLRARLARHLRGAARLHWHIDYLLRSAAVREIWYCESSERLECCWARALTEMPGVVAFAGAFGASDCSCHTHLFHSPVAPEMEAFQAAVAGEGSVGGVEVRRWPNRGRVG